MITLAGESGLCCEGDGDDDLVAGSMGKGAGGCT